MIKIIFLSKLSIAECVATKFVPLESLMNILSDLISSFSILCFNGLNVNNESSIVLLSILNIFAIWIDANKLDKL